jgi:2-aminoadipate transaminase
MERIDWKDQVSRTGEETIYQGIAAAVIEFIRSGDLAPGDRLPTIRELAKLLKVSPMTVSKAYALLGNRGVVMTRRGGGTVVAEQESQTSSAPKSVGKPLVFRTEGFSERMSRVAMAPGAISFLGGYPSSSDIDAKFLSDCVAKAISDSPESIFRYGNAAGVPALLELLSAKCRRFGNEIGAGQICVTSGAQQAIDIASRTLLAAGDTILVEAPTYFAALDTFRTQRLNVVPIAMEPDGIDPDVFAATARKLNAKAFYTTPNCHNPTGITTSQERREAIAAAAKSLNVTIIEDDYCPELLFHGDRPTSYFELCRETRNVFYINSLSKLHFPGLRMGFVATLSDGLKDLIAVKSSTDLHTSGVLQVTAAEYLKSQHFVEYSDQLVAKLRQKSETVRRHIGSYLGPQPFVNAASGGLNFWVTFGREVSDQDAFFSAVNNSVAYSVGSIFYPDCAKTNGIRISFGLTPEADLEEGIKRVARAINELETTPYPNMSVLA